MIVVVGVSHRKAPIEVRERLAIDEGAVSEVLARLLASPSIREAACLSTCNRIEIYAAARGTSEPEMTAAVRDIETILEDLAARNGAAAIGPYLHAHKNREAVRHLFRVASSLDSLVIGEPQILGQMKDAFDLAKGAGAVGKFLDRALSRALHAAKRVRTETSIGAGQVSVSSVAVDLARQIFGDLTGRVALLLGAGEMAEAAAKLLVKTGAKLEVVNRSPERATDLAREFGGTARPWNDLPKALVNADVVIASTSAKNFVITRAMTAQAMKARRGRSLFFIDIAVPRDIEPTVNELDNVYVYDIDNLSNIVAESMRGRKAEAERAEALVEHEADTFESWSEGLNVTGTIVALRAKVRASLAAELEKTLMGRLKHLPDADRKALDTMIEAAVNKLLHTPVSRLKAGATDPGGDELVQALHHLFDLAPLAPASELAPSAQATPALATVSSLNPPTESPAVSPPAATSATSEAEPLHAAAHGRETAGR